LELAAHAAAEVVDGCPDSLASAIDRLMCDEDLRERRSSAGYEFVRQHLSIDTVLDTLIDVYESAIAETTW
jgi:glycosyltransferase involved in cell wall biosynthesis